MSEKVRLVVTSRTIRPGREFLPGEVLVEGAAPDGVTLAQVNRLIGMGHVRAMNFDSAVESPPLDTQEPPVQTQEPPPVLSPVEGPVSTRAPAKSAPDPLAGKSPAEVRSELEQARKKDEAEKPKASRTKKSKK